MGVDTKLYINPTWRIEDVKDVLEKRMECKVIPEFHEYSPDYVVLKFPSKVRKEDRGMNVHLNTPIGGLSATCLTLRSDGEGIGVLRMLAETLGGLFQPADTEDTLQEFVKPGEGNIDFVIKEAIKSDPSLGHDDKGIASYILEKKWSSGKVWPKPIKRKE